MSGRNCSKLVALQAEQFGFQVADSVVGSGEFAGAVLEVALEQWQPVRGLTVLADLLTKLVDLVGPAVQVRFLAKLGELGALPGFLEFQAQPCKFALVLRAGGGRWPRGGGRA